MSVRRTTDGDPNPGRPEPAQGSCESDYGACWRSDRPSSRSVAPGRGALHKEEGHCSALCTQLPPPLRWLCWSIAAALISPLSRVLPPLMTADGRLPSFSSNSSHTRMVGTTNNKLSHPPRWAQLRFDPGPDQGVGRRRSSSSSLSFSSRFRASFGASPQALSYQGSH